MSALMQDVRYGLRNLARDPQFSAIAVLTLALAIGANTTIFGLINQTLLRPLPFPNPERLVLLWQSYGKGSENWNILSAPNFWDFQRESHSFSHLAIFDSAGRGYNLSSSNSKRESEQVSGVRVSAGFFPALGVKPLFGRVFRPEEEYLGRDRVVILSYALWQNRYGGRRSLLGQSIRIDGAAFTVIGVMPPDFSWQFWSTPRQLWVPVGYTKTDYGRGDQSFLSIGRLKPGVTEAAARTEVDAIAARLRQQYPVKNANMGATVSPLSDFEMEGLRRTLVALLATVGFVLLIGCVNIANLLLARGAARGREFAIRRALGAAGTRLARQLLTESVLLALAGGIAGLLLASWSNRFLSHVFAFDLLRLPLRPLTQISLDGSVFAFTALVSIFAGILFGLAPAFGALRSDVNTTLKESAAAAGTASSRHRLRGVLVAAEVALALVILCGAGLMIKSMGRLLAVHPGFEPRHVLTAEIALPQDEIYNGPPGTPRFCRDLTERLGSLSGVLSVGAVAHLPLQGTAGRSFQIEGRPPASASNMPNAQYSVACPGYFQTLGIAIRQGRDFTAADALNSPSVIVINEAMARKYWPRESALGHAIRVPDSNGARLTVVGIYQDVHQNGLDAPVQPHLLRPYPQAGWPTMTIVVRTAAAPATFAASAKMAMAAVLPDRPLTNFATMDDIVSQSVGARRFPMLLLGAFSFLALSLAAVGIVGVVSHSVAQRTREIGVRIALGAHTGQVLRLVINNSMRSVVAGLVVGLAAAAALTRLLGKLLFGVEPLDPTVLASVCLLLFAVALLASYAPARRASRIDPVTALRME